MRSWGAAGRIGGAQCTFADVALLGKGRRGQRDSLHSGSLRVGQVRVAGNGETERKLWTWGRRDTPSPA